MNPIIEQILLAALAVAVGIAALLSGLFSGKPAAPKADVLFDRDREFSESPSPLVGEGRGEGLVCTDCGSPDVLYVAPLLCGCCHIKRVEITRGCQIAGLTRHHQPKTFLR